MATLDKKQQGTMNTVAGVLPIAGTAIGSIWGPAGATVGGAAGGITGGILSTISGMLGEKPDSVGPTGAQKSVQSAALFNLSKLMSQNGLTAAQVSRMVELEGQADLASIQLMNVLEQSANMSPLAKEAVANTIVKETAKRGVDTAKNIANLDIQAEREREKALISGTAVASDVSTAIQQALTRQEAQENLWEQTRWTNFAANASAIGETAGALTEYFSEGTPKWTWDKNPNKFNTAEQQKSVDMSVASKAGILGAMESNANPKNDPFSYDTKVDEIMYSKKYNTDGVVKLQQDTPYNEFMGEFGSMTEMIKWEEQYRKTWGVGSSLLSGK